MTLRERIEKAWKDAKVARNIRQQAKHWNWVNYRPVTQIRKPKYE